jgi:CBS domain-containing protein
MSTVGDIVRGREVFTVQSKQTVLETVQYMVEKGIGAVAVMESDRMLGIFSERDLMKRVVTKKLDPSTISVEKVMTTNIITARPEESYSTCLARMQSHGIRHLVIAAGDQLIGIISLRDLMSMDIREKSAEIELMNQYLHYVPPAAA